MTTMTELNCLQDDSIVPSLTPDMMKALAEALVQQLETKISAMIDAKLAQQHNEQANSNGDTSALAEAVTQNLDSKISAMIETKFAHHQCPNSDSNKRDEPPKVTNPNPPTNRFAIGHLKAHDVGYFDPACPGEAGPAVSQGKLTTFRDVHMFVSWLKCSARASSEQAIKAIIESCLRGKALTWYLVELNESQRDNLQDGPLDDWFAALIKRFKIRASIAHARLHSASYSMQDIRNRDKSPQEFVQEMLLLAKSIYESTYSQLTLIWTLFDAELRLNIPEPRPDTTVDEFINHIDSKYAAWMDIANDPRPEHQQCEQGPYSAQQDNQPQQEFQPYQYYANPYSRPQSQQQRFSQRPRQRGGRLVPHSPFGKHASVEDETPNDPGAGR